MKQLFVLSPCGTSLLTNPAADDERKLVTLYANTKKLDEIPPEAAAVLQRLLDKVRTKLQQTDVVATEGMSAELNAITKLYRGQFNARGDQHWLLSTDTWLGEQTANLVCAWLEQRGLHAQVRRQRDLQTADHAAFQLALSDLVKWCEEEVKHWRNQYHVVFNLTGGFKSVQGFLQTLAMFYADEAVYVFESGTELLRIPRLPISLSALDTVRDHLAVFRRLANQLEEKETGGIPETLLVKIDDGISLSPWGELVWKQSYDAIYQERLWPEPSARIRYGNKFAGSLDDIGSKRLAMINDKMDQLAVLLEKDHNLKSLDFKKLKTQQGPSTHEFDAWSDQDAKRLFGHYDRGVFIVDRLDRHL